jgi:hypothetical protein
MQSTVTTEQRNITKQEISSSIVSGMGFVFDLYNELGSLLRYVQQGLDASDISIGKPLNARLTIHNARRGRSMASKWMQTTLGLIVQIEAESDDSEDDEEDEDEDELASDEGDEEEISSRARRKVSVTSDTQLIGVRATLYDPRMSKNVSFTPVLSGAVLADLERKPVGRRRKKADQGAKAAQPTPDFEINSGGLSRLLSHLDPGLTTGQRIACRVPRYEISATVSGCIEQELADFDAEDKLDGFIDSVVRLAIGDS